MLDKFEEIINQALGPFLKNLFHPIDTLLAGAYMPWAKIVALSYFVGTMIWIYVGLKKEYVNLEAPSDHLWYDLRFWTVLSMMPHVIVYLYL